MRHRLVPALVLVAILVMEVAGPPPQVVAQGFGDFTAPPPKLSTPPVQKPMPAPQRTPQPEGAPPQAMTLPPPGQSFRDCPYCPEMVVIPAGRFRMGSPRAELGRVGEEGPQHEVRIRYNLAVGKYEVTRAEFSAFARANNHNASGCVYLTGSKFDLDDSKNWQNPGFTQSDRHPVVCVNWDDAKAYVLWLSAKTGKPYRLLSEAEWEYAARAGTSAARWWGESINSGCSYANGADLTAKAQVPGVGEWPVAQCTDGHGYTAPVGSFLANAFGLYDTLGNAWEWVEDCWNGGYNGAPQDGAAWISGECGQRVLRGGSWYMLPGNLRSALRLRLVSNVRSIDIGFRVARTN